MKMEAIRSSETLVNFLPLQHGFTSQTTAIFNYQLLKKGSVLWSWLQRRRNPSYRRLLQKID
jgi:hypothetical protein